jgi:putative 4-mercaptohistidine N1-methyltranferase
LKGKIAAYYETDAGLSHYLLFHYGDDTDLMPYPFGPRESLHFPVRCVSQCLDRGSLPDRPKALELGCAVGRASFELSRYCQSVTGIDNSSVFIEAAKAIQQRGHFEYTIREEGDRISKRIALLPQGTNPSRVSLITADAMEFAKKSELFDIVLTANLLCRVAEPSAFLSLLKGLVVEGGQLILTTPYSWLEEYTPQARWLGQKEGRGAWESIKEILAPDFELQRHFDMPFLIREHLRKFQWGVSQASVWRRTSS